MFEQIFQFFLTSSFSDQLYALQIGKTIIHIVHRCSNFCQNLVEETPSNHRCVSHQVARLLIQAINAFHQQIMDAVGNDHRVDLRSDFKNAPSDLDSPFVDKGTNHLFDEKRIAF